MQNNKRIAKNTLFLYFRMILIMVVSLYTSRVILAELGITDYGIYNVVGGVVTMFSFLNSCMTTSTQRFLNIELGKGDNQRLNEVFVASLNIHIFIAVVVVLLAETIGLWFVNDKLVISYDRIFAANFVYQFSVLTFCLNIVQVPYNAVLIAHEKMNIYAYISIFEALLKLTVAYTIAIVPCDKLIAYSVFVFVVQLIIRAIYQIICRRFYEETIYRFFWNKDLYLRMSGFAGWNLFGSIAWLLRNQGLNILLNLFFGPTINAARGIASQVSGTVMGFISNFQVALNPQITKDYAVGNINSMERLAYIGTKFSFFLLFVIAFPLCLNINYILNFWLVEVPVYSDLFIILIMVDSLVGVVFGVPFMTSLSATGNIKKYQIVVSSLVLCILPVGYLALKLGYDAPSVFYISIAFTLVSGFVRFIFCIKQLNFSLIKMMYTVILPIILVLCLSLPLPIYLKCNYYHKVAFLDFIISSSTSVLLTLVIIWFVGLKDTERGVIVSFVKKRIGKFVHILGQS